MKSVTKQKILDAIREVLEKAGLPQPEEAAEIKRAAIAASSVKSAAKATVSIVVLEMWEGLQTRLDNAPEPEPEVLENDIRDVQNMVYMLRSLLKYPSRDVRIVLATTGSD